MDLILIEALEVEYCLGVTEAERARPQRVALRLEIETDFRAAAATDDLSKTIDYYAVTRRLLAFGQGRSWQLIERLAVEIAELVLTEFGGNRVTVEVRKFVIPEARHVAVRVVRRAATSDGSGRGSEGRG